MKIMKDSIRSGRALFKGFLSKRTTTYGTNTVLMTIIFIAILVFINFLSFRNYKRFDLTESGEFTISNQSKKVIKDLKREVKFTAFFDDGNPNREKFKSLMDTYKYETDKIKLEFVDPDKNPASAKQYKITSYETTIVESGAHSVRIKGVGEADITNAIIKVSRDKKKAIYFLDGHGEHSIDDPEKDGYQVVKKAIEDQGYEVKKLLLMQEGNIPDDCFAVVIGGPKKPFFPNEIETIKAFFNKGGSIFMMLDPDSSPELGDSLKELGIIVGKDIIIDTISRLFGGDFTIPVVTQYAEHEITKDFNIVTFFPLARSISAEDNKREGISLLPLLKTSENSWAETDINNREVRFDNGKDTRGPISLGIVLTKEINSPSNETSMSQRGTKDNENNPNLPPLSKVGNKVFSDESGKDDTTTNKTKKASMVVLGDSDFTSNMYFNFSGNGDLFMNILNWLVKEDDLISIRVKNTKSSPIQLTREQGTIIFSLSVIIVPAIILMTGIIRWWKRRRL